MKKRNIFLTLLLLLLLPMGIGCTKEDYRNCPAGLWIAFETINPKHVYTDQVQRVSLYFYDPVTNELAADFHYMKEDLRPEDGAAFIPQMNSGDYRLVAIVNTGIYTTTTGTESYITLRTALDSEVMNYKPADLYTAEKEISVKVNASQEIPVETMNLAKHNNNVHLNIIYDEGYVPTPGTAITSWLEGNNALYEYATRSATGSGFASYGAWETRTNEVEQKPDRFSFTTMRLWRGCDVKLILREVADDQTRGSVDGMRYYELNLVDELAKILDEDDPDNIYLYDTDEELEFEDEYELTVRLGKDKIQLAVGLDQWDTIGGGVEL